jgi:DNA-directed RNA polymerase subunit omega
MTMARVTVEDCVKVIESRFELILIAAERSRILSKGAEPLLDRDRDKNPVVALREIAEKKLDLEQTKETLVKGLQKYHEEVLTEPHEGGEDMKEQIVEKPQLSEDIIEDVEKNASEAGLSIDENS